MAIKSPLAYDPELKVTATTLLANTGKKDPAVIPFVRNFKTRDNHSNAQYPRQLIGSNG